MNYKISNQNLLIEVSDIVTNSPGNVDGDNEFQDPFN